MFYCKVMATVFFILLILVIHSLSTEWEIPAVKKYPFVVSIQKKWKEQHVCLGTIINVNYVITSCNCFCDWNEPWGERVCYGKGDFVLYYSKNRTAQDDRGESKEIAALKIHPDCGRFKKRLGWDYNMAIVVSKSEFKSWPSAKPIFNLVKREAVASLHGYQNGECTSVVRRNGSTFVNLTNRIYFQAVELTVLTFDDCIKAICLFSHDSCLTKDSDDDHHICVRPLRFDNHICELDQGAPLLCANRFWAILDWKPLCSTSVRSPALFSILNPIGVLYNVLKDGSSHINGSTILTFICLCLHIFLFLNV
ncbi:uncharacterized protein LOC106673248 [Cimex lectularius]|uniref:Peptidase S1 domain-containing protein n=1 Tax=Cimex lectularius TaxID=79782 RepID=A0A8I6S805_CIMLE|nr:uncharacterized protein LOC106673248 [Cimex lectularius]